MLMYGFDKPEVLGLKFSGQGVVYNLTSLKEGYYRLRLLVPPNSLGKFTDRDFDIVYANYIFGNNYVFAEFFQIIYNLYLFSLLDFLQLELYDNCFYLFHAYF